MQDLGKYLENGFYSQSFKTLSKVGPLR